MLKNLKNNKKKGFTLVELIVVLVILAILAALLIPALTGYIDKAKNKSVIAETRQAVMAAQTIIDEQYAKNNAVGLKGTTGSTPTYSISVGTNDTSISNGTITIKETDITGLAEVDGKIGNTITINEKGKITKLEYTKNGKKCTYEPGGTNTDGDYNVETAPAASGTP